ARKEIITQTVENFTSEIGGSKQEETHFSRKSFQIWSNNFISQQEICISDLNSLKLSGKDYFLISGRAFFENLKSKKIIATEISKPITMQYY
ncbi:hypothetical protein MXB_3901, partial [Myxobolus squamalis]